MKCQLKFISPWSTDQVVQYLIYLLRTKSQSKIWIHDTTLTLFINKVIFYFERKFDRLFDQNLTKNRSTPSVTKWIGISLWTARKPWTTHCAEFTFGKPTFCNISRKSVNLTTKEWSSMSVERLSNAVEALQRIFWQFAFISEKNIRFVKPFPKKLFLPVRSSTIFFL